MNFQTWVVVGSLVVCGVVWTLIVDVRRQGQEIEALNRRMLEMSAEHARLLREFMLHFRKARSNDAMRIAVLEGLVSERRERSDD